MKLAHLLETVSSSFIDDWNVIPCWGAYSGKSYRTPFTCCFADQGKRLRSEEHSLVAVYEPDISIVMTLGPRLAEFKEDWARNFVQPDAYSSFVDLFYKGMLVYRDTCISVDGMRANLPLPHTVRDKERQIITAMGVSESRYKLFRLVDALHGGKGFDRYWKDAGMRAMEDRLCEGSNW